MTNIVETLRNTYILSAATTEAMEQYIAGEYPNLTKDEANKVLIQYLQQQIEEHLLLFDAKYQTFIKFRLVHNVITRRPYTITAEDVFKACLQLNVGIDGFYNELTNWLDQNLAGTISVTELAAYVEQLRCQVAACPEQSLDELLQTTQIPIVLATNPESVGQEQAVTGTEPGDGTTNLSQEFFHIYDIVGAVSDPEGPVNVTFQVKPKGVQFAAAGIGLLLLAGSVWGLSTYMQRIAAPTQLARTTVPLVASLPEASTNEAQLEDYSVNPRRVSRRKPVSRSYISKTLITNLVDNGRRNSDQSTAELVAENRVIVGYENVVVNNVTTRVPIVQSYCDKLEMQAVAYGVAKKVPSENTVTTQKDAGNDKQGSIEKGGVAEKTDKPGQAGTNPPTVITAVNRPGKVRTVGVDPSVIAPGSRLYIKFPREYHDLTGIYIAGEPRTENQGKRIDLCFGETTEDNDEVKKNIDAFGSRDVEVYVLKKE